MGTITGYHAHVYFDEKTIEKARALCELVTSKFDLDMGRVHEKNVGPHPMWSCQLAFDKNKFGRVIPWLAMNRDGLVVFTHPISGDELSDHVEHALWMGAILELNVNIFK